MPDSVLPSCSSTVGNITTTNQTAFDNGLTPSDIDVFLYTPCNVTINNNLSMTLQQMPLLGAQDLTTTSYIAEHDYKREVPSS